MSTQTFTKPFHTRLPLGTAVWLSKSKAQELLEQSGIHDPDVASALVVAIEAITCAVNEEISCPLNSSLGEVRVNSRVCWDGPYKKGSCLPTICLQDLCYIVSDRLMLARAMERKPRALSDKSVELLRTFVRLHA